ncbi:gamma-glutamyltransferase [soil metagenome]
MRPDRGKVHPPRPPTRAVIAADSPLTAAAGARIAREGGNAVDIAVGAAFAASLAEILLCSLGGSAFVMVGMPDRPAELIEGADAMPGLGRDRDTLADLARSREVLLPYGEGITVRNGHGAVAVPGMPAALELAWKRHGRLPWPELLAPALDLARNGFPIGSTTARWLALVGPSYYSQQQASQRCFFPRGIAPAPGEHFRIPDMDQTLEILAREGSRAFYEGSIADAFAQEMEDHGGLVSRTDLSAYRAVVRRPLSLRSRGFELSLNPPPAVGGAALGTLIGLLEQGWNEAATDADRVLMNAQAQTVLLRLREQTLADPALDDGTAQALLEPEVLRKHWGALRAPSTTHLSVATADGGLVAITMSNGYDAGVTIPGTGIPCNNALGEPELNPRGYLGNLPGSRMPSNMAPSLAIHPDGRRLAIGSPGATRISTALAQCWTQYAFEGAPIGLAIAAPRLHVEPLDETPGAGLRVLHEPGLDTSLLPPSFVVRPFETIDMFFGGIKAVLLEPDGRLLAVADARRQGAIEVVD